MNKQIAILNNNKEQLLKALGHLKYSFNKLSESNQKLNFEDDETLETWESFSFRFSRVVDIFLAKYLSSYALYHDPEFKGSLRDHINLAEKLQLIDDANYWLSLRELRNIAPHEYNDQDLNNFYQQIFKECNKLLKLKPILVEKTPCE